MTESTTKESEGGRWGRTPYKPEDLKAEYGMNEQGKRLSVICPGCGNDWYPSPKCCVDRYAGDAFCPQCGTDFRADPEDVHRFTSLKIESRTDDAAESLREFVAETDGLEIGRESEFYREEQSEPKEGSSTDSDQ